MPKSLREPVFLISFGIILALVALGAAFPEGMQIATGGALEWVTYNLGWFYLVSVFGFVVILVFLGFSKYGGIKLGKPDSKPEFTFFSWVAMLLAAGFGVGLVFYGVAEPMSHYLEPPYGMAEPATVDAARLAIQFTYFNWGVHQWAAFSIVGLIIGFFSFRKEKPALVSSFLEPVTRRMWCPRGIATGLDVFAVVATVMGVATSLGLGVLQLNGGLNTVFGIPENTAWQAVILTAVAGAYILSTASGLDKGIKVLSTINLVLAVLLAGYVLAMAPTLPIFEIIVQGLGDYLQNFLKMSLHTAPYLHANWAGKWTVFYWAWVIAWSPFVGMFVARISRGRTIREYIFGVLVMPPLLACLWMGVFGGASLYLEVNEAAGLAAATEENITSAFFELFNLLPLSTPLSILGMLLIFIFLVTSADSASFILGQMTSRGSIHPPLFKRLAWGGLIAAICLTLIAVGGLEGLQAGAVVAALPFTFILYLMVWTLFRELAADRRATLERLYKEHGEIPVGASVEEVRDMKQ